MQQGNQEAIQQFIDSLKNTTLNAKPKRVNSALLNKKTTTVKQKKKQFFWNRNKKKPTNQKPTAIQKPRAVTGIPKTRPAPPCS